MLPSHSIKQQRRLELETAKTRMEVEAMTIQQKETSEQPGALKKAAEPTREELKRIKLDETVERELAKLATIEKNSKTLREKAKHLQENLEIAGGGKLQQQKAVMERLQKHIDKKSTAINKKKVQSTSSKTIKTLEKAIETTNVEKAKSLEEKEQRTAEFKR